MQLTRRSRVEGVNDMEDTVRGGRLGGIEESCKRGVVTSSMAGRGMGMEGQIEEVYSRKKGVFKMLTTHQSAKAILMNFINL